MFANKNSYGFNPLLKTFCLLFFSDFRLLKNSYVRTSYKYVLCYYIRTKPSHIYIPKGNKRRR